MRTTTVTARRTDWDALTILRVNIIPETSSHIAEEAFAIGLGLDTTIGTC